eukprot:TRINITY_DN22970_c0_g1_i1.p1 TRINITY_DN22970_c0_g1~~TRINITY_DN22970_c0_g1_i1.p1  ORF type:complete len:439 (+),score=80.54 TRINITY_DN22970_c0_g1_i1:99-1319(+)
MGNCTSQPPPQQRRPPQQRARPTPPAAPAAPAASPPPPGRPAPLSPPAPPVPPPAPDQCAGGTPMITLSGSRTPACQDRSRGSLPSSDDAHGARVIPSEEQPPVLGMRRSSQNSGTCRTIPVGGNSSMVTMPVLALGEAGLVKMPPEGFGRLHVPRCTALPEEGVRITVAGREIEWFGSDLGIFYTVGGKRLPASQRLEWTGSVLRLTDTAKEVPLESLSRAELAAFLSQIRALADSHGVAHNIWDTVRRTRCKLLFGATVACRTAAGWRSQGRVVGSSEYEEGQYLYDVRFDEGGEGDEAVLLQGWHRGNVRGDGDTTPRHSEPGAATPEVSSNFSSAENRYGKARRTGGGESESSHTFVRDDTAASSGSLQYRSVNNSPHHHAPPCSRMDTDSVWLDMRTNTGA